MAAVARDIQRAFSGGEQSPELAARADLARYRTALRTMENFVPLVRGVATRRPPWMDVHAAMSASVLREFAFSDSDAYAIEFGAGNTRFFRDYGILETSPGTPYELANPFTADELPNIATAQSADVLYITTGARPVQKLKRVANTNWTLTAADLKKGPFRDENADQTFTLSTTFSDDDMEIGATVPLVASAALFQAGHVGALFLIKIPDQGEHGKWAAQNSELTTGSRVYWGDNFYVCDDTHNGETGTDPPVHLTGAQWDGPIEGGGSKSRRWVYKHSGWGVLKVTEVTDSTHATAVAMTYIPDELKTGTWRWAEGAFSDYRGHPSFAALHDQRLYLFETGDNPTGGWASRIDDYENFDGQNPDEADAAFRFRLEGNGGKVNLPRWLLSAGNLFIGTAGDEMALVAAGAENVQPDAFKIIPVSTEGSARVPALRVEGVLFVSADESRVMEIAFDPNAVQQNAYVANDLTLYADHIGEAGFKRIVWQREPYRVLWARLNDGTIAACTFRKDQDVLAWHRHPSAKAFFEDICAVPAPAKKRQDVWAIVTRALAGGTVRRIECLAPWFQKLPKTQRTATNAVFADAAQVYDGAPATTISGLSRLNGEQVAVLADGKVVRGLTVSGGQITLPKAASKVVVGLPMTSIMRTLRFDRDAAAGVLSGRLERVKDCIIDVIDTAGVEACAGENAFELLKPSGGANMDAPAELYSGPLRIDALESAWRDGDITVRAASPLPATIRAISAPYQVSR